MHIPFNTLNAFEAAARHLSFKAAANELNLSPSAVSHAIAKLERELGALLFDRDSRQLALTLDGQMLQRPIEEAIGLIRAGIQSVSNRQAQTLRLHVAPSFAGQWLTPRLQQFLSANPGMDVQIAADTDYSRFTSDEFDADIVYGAREQDGLISHGLGAERIVPMCSPAMAAHIKKPADLIGLTLIRSTLKSISWEAWLRANGVTPPPIMGMRFDRSFMAITAASDGLGVCLDSTRLAERELSSGRLVMPLPDAQEVAVIDQHFLVYPRRNAERPIVIAFTKWLMDTLGHEQEGASID